MYSIASNRLACTARARSSARALCAHMSRKPAVNLIRWLRGTTKWVAGSAARPSRLHGASCTSRGLFSPHLAPPTCIRTASELTIRAGSSGCVNPRTSLGTRSQSTNTSSPASSDLTFFLLASRATSEAASEAEGAGAVLAAAIGATDGSAKRGGWAGRPELPSGPAAERRRSSCPFEESAGASRRESAHRGSHRRSAEAVPAAAAAGKEVEPARPSASQCVSAVIVEEEYGFPAPTFAAPSPSGSGRGEDGAATP
mmetsp:Transcript_41975/g.135412  ORF Transcript_41975/g.135412 Transcript_41975/m.135412 type:complete len:256 (-) Transcript_41975:1006-1773(-)